MTTHLLDPSSPLLTYSQAASFLNIKPGTLYAMVSQGRIPHVRLSKRMVRFDRSELRRWVESRRVDTSGR